MTTRVRIITDTNLLYLTEKRYGPAPFTIAFSGKRSIKDLLESAGIPHVETGHLEVEREGLRQTAGLDELIEGDCVLRVKSAAETSDFSDIGDISLLRFILDVHLGRLSSNLRMLGFNADYSNNRDDAELEAAVSGISPPCIGILLSCDRGLLKRRGVDNGMLVRSRNHIVQASEVLLRFRLSALIRPFTLCISCGAPLGKAGSLAELGGNEAKRIPPAVRKSGFEYSRCSGCGRLYWPGSHLDRMREKVSLILSLVEP